eukprot:2434599-Amphidinium_carterae.1
MYSKCKVAPDPITRSNTPAELEVSLVGGRTIVRTSTYPTPRTRVHSTRLAADVNLDDTLGRVTMNL